MRVSKIFTASNSARPVISTRVSASKRKGDDTTPAMVAGSSIRKLRAVSVRKKREILIGDTEDFTQHADDLVTVERIRHDRAKRRQPGVRGMVALQIALGLNRNRHAEFAQLDCHHAQPRLARAENRDVTPGIRAQILVAGRF